MTTFSINISTNTESTAYPLVTTTDVDTILTNLIDNTSKLINPWDLRDSILSLYSSSAFKITTPTSVPIEYVGIDSLDLNNRDSKNKILIGKRAFSATNSYVSTHDILTTFSFSNYDTDVYFFNTKTDTLPNDETKISILAGTSLSLYQQAPYIRTQRVTSTSSLSLDIVNNSAFGNINISSLFGTVSFNNIVFPTYVQSYSSASNNKTLFYENGKVVWGDISYPVLSYIGMTGTPLQIYGTPVNINNYSLEFTDNRRLPRTVNDMITGSTFINQPLVEIIKKILYPYLKPLCSIELLAPFDGGFSEVGTFPTPVVRVSITKRSFPTLPATITNTIPSVVPAISSLGQITQVTPVNGIVISPITPAITTFVVSVSDGTQSASASTTIQGIYPYFYGFSSLSSMTTIGLSSLTKSLELKTDKNITVSGTGNLFFIYDSTYGTLSNIYDWLGNTASASFSHSTQIFSSPTGLWAAKQFHVYKWTSAPTIVPPGLNFEFQY